MIFYRTKAAVGAAIGALLVPLPLISTARSEPVPRFAKPDVPSLVVFTGSLQSWTAPEPRPAAVEREHIRAQRIINRVCAGC